ncbi:glycosyltransferase family 2 protein [Polynucleobacter ibericus]|uniref:glycosyltransferase family 2 protein n=1 Tax=Polynucleobacter ibericus TaxID=1819725 RepID=UPI001BFEE44D|nr:glycosyltransferase family 2 protein [Polynucleobacter ibericus]QWE08978.1 glycosyltransferase family 2 protein [Polynucleobacter ibericus]
MRIILASQYKNESMRVVEWLEYYRDRGITDFILCDDHSTDNSIEVINGVAGINVIHFSSLSTPTRFSGSSDTELYKWDLEHPQNQHKNFRRMFAYACEHFDADTAIGFLDMDEFIFTNARKSLVEVISESIKPYAVMSICSFEVDSRTFELNGQSLLAQTTRSMSVKSRTHSTRRTSVKSFINLGHPLRCYAFTEPVEEIGAGIHTAGLPLSSRQTIGKLFRKRLKNWFRALLNLGPQRWYALEDVWVPKDPLDRFSLDTLWLRVDPFSLSYLHYRTPSYDMSINSPLFDCDYDLQISR